MIKIEKKFREDLVAGVKSDFAKRQEARLSHELQWRLNKCFLLGKQDYKISHYNTIERCDDTFYWQKNESFNHIAPIIDSRLAKLNRVKPAMNVRAKLNNDEDIMASKLASKLLSGVSVKCDLTKLISQATVFSETYGTVFYRIDWNNDKGLNISEKEKEGDVDICILSPFYVYPQNLFEEDLSNQESLIVARAVSCADILRQYNVSVPSENLYSQNDYTQSEKLEDCCMLIEKMELPTKEFPQGRYIVVAGNELLEYSDMPYKNGVDEVPTYPIIKQVCIKDAGSFFGVSILERLIPVQRAYNIVKNRKFEFLNRISAGVYTVEDGSVDTDALAEEGLPPGKVLIYRQGSRPPQMMDYSRVPIDFSYEEDRLLNEFILISGVSEIMRNSKIPNNSTSGVALSILVEQDETRLSLSAENIRDAIKNLGVQIIRLYKQFSQNMRLISVAGDDNELEVYYFNACDLTNDDVVFDTENEMLLSPSQKKSFVFDLLASGLLSDENGKLTGYVKAKILEMLEFNAVENGQEMVNLQVKSAKKENLKMKKDKVEVLEIDDNELHIIEHTKFVLSNNLSKNYADKIIEHINAHKSKLDEKVGKGEIL